MLDNLLTTRLYDAATREGLDLNDPVVQQKIFTRRQQIENILCDIIAKQTKHCGCGNNKK